MRGREDVGRHPPPAPARGRARRTVSSPGRRAAAPVLWWPPRPSCKIYPRGPGARGGWRCPGSRHRCRPWHWRPPHGCVPARRRVEAGWPRAAGRTASWARPGGRPAVRTGMSQVQLISSPSACPRSTSSPGWQLAARQGRDPLRDGQPGHWQARAAVCSRRNRLPTRRPAPRGSLAVHAWCTRCRRQGGSPRVRTAYIRPSGCRAVVRLPPQ